MSSHAASQQGDLAAKSTSVTMGPMASAEDAEAFRTLNEEWINLHFRLEPKDSATLNDPQGTIVARGGQVYLARLDGVAVGCVALIRDSDTVFELSKMAVAPAMRGQGVGRRLLAYAIEQAPGLGARSLWLGSNSRLKNAVHLYEAAGFRHVDPETLPASGYARADVFMQLDL